MSNSEQLGQFLRKGSTGGSWNGGLQLDQMVPRLTSDPIASIIQSVSGSVTRPNEWVRLRGFSVHATKRDVLRFMEGVAIKRTNVKAELDDVRAHVEPLCTTCACVFLSSSSPVSFSDATQL